MPTILRAPDRLTAAQRKATTCQNTAQAPAPTIAAIPPADVLGRLAALQAAPIAHLKQQWRELFELSDRYGFVIAAGYRP